MRTADASRRSPIRARLTPQLPGRHVPRPFIQIVLLCASLLVVPNLARAQWRTQTIQLQPGWNAVHLEIQPQPDDCDTLLAALPIESVWKWNRRFSTIQFVKDPATLLPEDPDWLVWLPTTDKHAFLRRLRSLDANQSYLIKVADDASPVTLTIKGQVVVPSLDWFPHGLNLAGFPVNPVDPPTFADFFKFTPEVNTSLSYANQLFSLNSLGHGVRIVQPNRERIQPGVAYWVRAEKKPRYIASLHVIAPGGAIDFGATLHSQNLEILNVHPSESMDVIVRLKDSESPPSGSGFPELAGAVPLSYLSRNTNGIWSWIEFPANGLAKTLAPGERWTLRLGIRRNALAPYQPVGTNGATYQGILEVTDAAQSLLIPVPVTAFSPELGSTGAGSTLTNFNTEAGLWVGEASLNQINAPAYTGTNVISTPAPLSLRLIVHVDDAGQARLLQEVVLAWDPTLNESPHTNGTYALYADEAALPANASQIKRISSEGFPIMSPMSLSGSLTNELTGTVNIAFNDPTNPFLHRYHAMHDNKDGNFKPYTNAVEVPNISRAISMTFTAITNDTADPLLGVDVLSGTYNETILGLRAQPIHVQGPFALQRISQITQIQGTTP